MNKKLSWICWDHPTAQVLISYDFITKRFKWTCGMCGRELRAGAEVKK